jgi:hypothetical protein
MPNKNLLIKIRAIVFMMRMKILLKSLLFIPLAINSKLDNDELVYSEPNFPLKNPNFTLGGMFSISSSKQGDSTINKDGLEGSLAMMCTLKNFNSGKGPFPVSGVFNGLIYDSGEGLKEAEFAAMNLLQYNLHTSIDVDQSDLNVHNNTIQVGAIIAKLNTNIFFATQPIFSGFPFTFLGVQYINSGIFGANFASSTSTNAIRPQFKARLMPQSYVISAASSSAMAEAIVQMLIYFNWSLCTVIYSRDAFGMEGQAFLQPALQANNILTTCSIITSSTNNEDADSLFQTEF